MDFKKTYGIINVKGKRSTPKTQVENPCSEVFLAKQS